jgi:hypothetical protein
MPIKGKTNAKGEDQVRYTVDLPRPIWQALREEAVRKGETVKEILLDAILRELKRRR